MIDGFSLLVCHLVGDFIFQNDFMQKKSQSYWICLVHVLVYCLPFLVIQTPLALLGAIAVQHYLQDRFALHVRWMRLFKQTSPERWPEGPLCVDQAFHIAFIFLFWQLIPTK